MARRMLSFALVAAIGAVLVSVPREAEAYHRRYFHRFHHFGGFHHLGFRPHFGFYGYPYYGGFYGPFGGGSSYGDVRIRVSPDWLRKEARVFVDGKDAGKVDDFDGSLQRLRLIPGGHRIEIRLDGYETLTKELHVSPGNDYDLRAPLVMKAN